MSRNVIVHLVILEIQLTHELDALELNVLAMMNVQKIEHAIWRETNAQTHATLFHVEKDHVRSLITIQFAHA